jgi:replicative DNA helicase
MVPHNLEAEESLLGAMLLSYPAISACWGIVDATDFFAPRHGVIYEAIVSLWSRGLAVDVITVGDELGRQGRLEQVGGYVGLSALSASTPSISNAPRYAQIVADCAVQRRLIEVGYEIQDLGYQVDVDNVADNVEKAEELVFQVGQRLIADSLRHIEIPIQEVKENKEHVKAATASSGEIVIRGHATGFKELDRCLLGLQPSNLIIVGARPSMGKTSFALNIVRHVALSERVPVLMFSLEMSGPELAARMACAEAGVDAQRLRNGTLRTAEEALFDEAALRLQNAPIFLDDSATLTVMDMRAKARRLKARHGLGLVVVDYLQLMMSSRRAENRQVEVSEISRGLKVLARELEVPVVALSQLSRNLEMRADKRPMLADLRESGSLEQDADVVMFIYRDDVYHPNSPDRDNAELIVAKHRNGPTGVFKVAFLRRFATFKDFQETKF